MLPHRTVIFKPFLTISTTERIISGMQVFVSLQMFLSHKRFPTILTLHRVAGMRSLVQVATNMRFIPSPAKFAPVIRRTWFGVGALVVFKPACVGKFTPAEATLVRLLPFVDAFTMLHHVFLPGKRFATDFTQERLLPRVDS